MDHLYIYLMEKSNPHTGIIINVTGRVQGVGFRYYTKQEADRLNLSGTVQNLQDGSVAIKAAGNVNDIHSFIEWCKSGPPSSIVESLEFQFSKIRMNEGFHIVR